MNHDFLAGDLNKCFWTRTYNVETIFKSEEIHIRAWIVKAEHTINIESIGLGIHSKSLREYDLKCFTCAYLFLSVFNFGEKFCLFHIDLKGRFTWRRNLRDISCYWLHQLVLHSIKARLRIAKCLIYAFVGTIPVNCIGNQDDCSIAVIENC